MKRQTIGRKRASNVICRIKGEHDYLVVVGAHYDRIGRVQALRTTGLVLFSLVN